MKALFRFISFRHLTSEKGKSALSLIGVALGVAVFVSIRIANVSVLEAFRATIDSVAGKANLQVVSRGPGFDERDYSRIRAASGVEAAAPVIEVNAPCADLPGETLLVLGVDIFSEPPFRLYDFLAEDTGNNRALDFLTDPGAIVITASFARRHGLKEGAKLRLLAGAERKAFTIRGVIESARLEQALGGNLAVMDIAAAQEAFSKIGRLDRIDLIVSGDQTPEAWADRLKTFLPPDAAIRRPGSRSLQVEQMVSAFQLNLTALSFIAILVGMFLIYNSIAVSVLKRRKEIGMLRALGTSRRQILMLFLLEAAFFGAVGSAAGLGLGVLMAKGALSAVSRTVSELYILVEAQKLYIPISVLSQGFGIGMTTTLAAALFPALEAARVPPRETFGETGMNRKARRLALRLAFGGGVCLAAAWALSAPGRALGGENRGFVAALLIIIGFSALTPLVTLAFSRLLAPPIRWLLGIIGELAGKSLVESLRRTSIAIAALMVSIALLVSLSVLIFSFRRTVEVWISQSVKADLFVSAASRPVSGSASVLPEAVIAYARSLPEVEAADTLRSIESEYNGNPFLLAAVDMAVQTSQNRLMLMRGDKRDILRRTRDSGEVIVSESFASKHRAREGQTVVLTTPSGPRLFRIAGLYYDYSTETGVILMDRRVFTRYWRDALVNNLALYLKFPSQSGPVAERIRRHFAGRYDLMLTPNGELRARVMRIFDQTFAITYALRLIAIIVAVLGVTDTMLALVAERGREIAVLRAVGTSAAQIRRITLTESGLMGLIAFLIGSVAGIALSLLLIFVINRQFFGWTIQFALPSQMFVQSFLLVMASCMAAGAIPAHFAARSSLAETIRTE